MTARELAEILRHYPADAEVMVSSMAEGGLTPVIGATYTPGENPEDAVVEIDYGRTPIEQL